MAAGHARILRGVPQRRLFSSTARRLDNYGFIGLGQMGYQMAKNLQSKLAPTDTVRLFDINRDAMTRLADEMRSSQAGDAAVELAESVGDASKDADTVITVLPEPAHVKSVYASILESLSRNDANSPGHRRRLFIDCSTIDPTTSREVAASVSSSSSSSAANNSNGTFVDAPMSGGVVGATAGTLTFMLGAPASLLPAIEPILLRMGRRVLHCGDQGAGLSAKLANNYLLAISNIATAEAMALGITWGLDPKVLAGVINASTGKCWPSEINNPVPGVVEGSPASRGDYQGGFGVGLMRKDLGLALKAAQTRLALGGVAKEVYDATERSENCKGRDFSVVYRYLGGKE